MNYFDILFLSVSVDEIYNTANIIAEACRNKISVE